MNCFQSSSITLHLDSIYISFRGGGSKLTKLVEYDVLVEEIYDDLVVVTHGEVLDV